MNSEKPKLIYVGDPMCSWCYGISGELELLKAELGDKLEYEIVMGGLRPYNIETMSDLKSFLTGHWQEVNARSGLKFSYGILDSETITYDTEPPCRAVMLARSLHPEKAFQFFHEVQKAFYQENKNMHELGSYLQIIEELGIDQEAFSEAFDKEETKAKIKLDFERAAALGVQAFPTILLESNGEMHVIARGYSTKEKMGKRIYDILQF